MNIRNFFCFCAFAVNLFFVFDVSAQYKIEVLDSNTFHLSEGVRLSKISFRGLSVVDDKTIWISGSMGTIARSIDGGKTFSFQQIKGYEKSDFRDIEAFDDRRAIIMSSGTPAYILKTIDGGQTWKEVFKDIRSEVFLDAMDFWNDQRGIIVGDPVDHHFLLLQTRDGGDTWTVLDTSVTPVALDSEAIFAASGTSLKCIENPGFRGFEFITGGKYCRMIVCDISSLKMNCTQTNLQINHGKKTSGAFSLTAGSHLMIVGGDYAIDPLVKNNSLYSDKIDTGEFYSTISDVCGYRSCVDEIDEKIFIACGTSGTDIFENKKWQNISKESFHVVHRAKNGKAVFLAGSKGKIGKLIY